MEVFVVRLPQDAEYKSLVSVINNL